MIGATFLLPLYAFMVWTAAKLHFNQYSETNVMHFLFNLLRIKGLYMLRALFAHPQEVVHKRHLVYCVRVISVRLLRMSK
jgi:Na+/phosphate symporter